MVEAGLLAKTDEDSRSDFEGAYDFEEAFRKPFLPASKLVAAEKLTRAATKPGKA